MDVIIHSTSGRTGLVGIWKRSRESGATGWIDGKSPRMISVQFAGCAPMVKAWETGRAEAEPWGSAQTTAAGLRVPEAIGDFLVLDTIRQSHGAAVCVNDGEIVDAMGILRANEGIFSCPEDAATITRLRKLVEAVNVIKTEKIVLFNTGGYQEEMHHQLDA